jgi:hypothetical protein
MSMRFRLVLTAFAALLAAPVFSATITVEGVVSPAWVERAGAGRVPLEVGMTLENTDKVHTGRNSRALLRIADGSAVKLGEDAVLGLDGLSDRKDERARRLVTASLDVVRGAFRFTTGIFDKRPSGRNVNIRVATVTTGIRGTDLWGKSDEKRDLVCLIEGRISVTHAQTGEFTMSEPLSFFVAPRDAKPLPVAPVDMKQLALWAAETEIAAGSGGARRGGRVHVDAVVSPDQAVALAAYDRLRAAGYPAVMRPLKSAERVDYRVRVQNFPTQQDAAVAVEKLKALGLTEATVSK